MDGRGDERAEAMERRPRIARTHTRMRVMGTPVRSERRMYPEADATQRGRTRARTRNNRTPTRAPRRRSEVRVSKYRYMSVRIYICLHPHIRAYTRRWAAAERGWGRRCVCACASRHSYADVRLCVCASIQGIRTCLDAQASIQTFISTDGHTTLAHMHTCARSHGICMHTHTHTHIHPLLHTKMYTCSDTHLVGANTCRSRRALAHTLAWNLHINSYACTRTHTYTYTHGDTHLAVAGSCCAAAPAARANTHRHLCNSARTDAEMHSTSTLRLTYNRAYKCRYFIHIYIYIWI